MKGFLRPLSRKEKRKISARLKNIGLENISYRIRINYEGGNGGIQLYNGNPGVRAVLWIPGRIFSIPEDEMLAER